MSMLAAILPLSNAKFTVPSRLHFSPVIQKPIPIQGHIYAYSFVLNCRGVRISRGVDIFLNFSKVGGGVIIK